MQGQEIRKTIESWFAGQVAAPAEVDRWPSGVELTGAHTMANFGTDPKRLYLFGTPTLVDLLSSPGGKEDVALSYWGHGINSYAWTLYHRRPGLRFLAQVPYGGAFAGAGSDEAQAEELWGLYEEALRTADVVEEGDLVVCASSMRGLSAVLVAPGEVSPEDLRSGSQDDPWQSLRRLRGEVSVPPPAPRPAARDALVVVPVGKCHERTAAYVVRAAVQALPEQAAWTVIDCFGVDPQELPLTSEQTLEEFAEDPAAPAPSRLLLRSRRRNLEPLSAQLRLAADLVSARSRLVGAGHHVLVIGPRLLPSRSPWLYAGVSAELARTALFVDDAEYHSIWADDAVDVVARGERRDNATRRTALLRRASAEQERPGSAGIQVFPLSMPPYGEPLTDGDLPTALTDWCWYEQ